MSKLSKIMHIGKIICGGVAVVLGIVALATPAAPIIIAAAVIGLIAWICDTGEDIIAKTDDIHQSDIYGDDDDSFDMNCWNGNFDETIEDFDITILEDSISLIGHINN